MRTIDGGEVMNVVEAAPSVLAAVIYVRDLLGIEHLTYHLAPIDAAMGAPFVKSTYPDRWLSRYLVREYVRVDPVVREGFQRQLPFFWSELTLNPQAADLMADAIAFGLGTSGYSVPVVDKRVRRALVSLNSAMGPEVWNAFVETNRHIIIEVANRLHRKAIVEIFGDLDPMPRLAPREIEVLRWTAKGKDYRDIGVLLGLSPYTVRAHLRSARYKLNCSTIAQAIARAFQLGLLRG